MWLLGMPNPALWGGSGGGDQLHSSYLGGFACTAILGIVALVEFDSIGRALTVSGVFLALNTLEGSFLTPMIQGRQL